MRLSAGEGTSLAAGLGGLQPDLTAIGITVILAVIYFGSRKIRKRGLSPILLIGIAAIVGMLVYR